MRLKKGYTVAWAADVSERYFSWKNGVAFVPEKEVSEMSNEEALYLFLILLLPREHHPRDASA